MPSPLYRVRQSPEVGHAALVLDNDLTIDQRRSAWQTYGRFNDAPVSLRPIVPVARKCLDLAGIDREQRAISIVLDLMHPIVAGRR
jgi:hypothetical protein